MTAPAVDKFDFIVNRRAGTVLKTGEDELRRSVLETFGEKAGDFQFVEGGDVADAVRDWAVKNAGGTRGLVIGGGDGTILTAADQVMGRSDITLGVLPLGTVNGIARKLGFSSDFRKAAAQYEEGACATMDVGKVNGMSFLCGLVIDTGSVKIFEAREHLRDRKIFSSLRKAFSAAAHMLHWRKKMVVDNGQETRVYKGRMFALTPAALHPRPLRHMPKDGRMSTNIIGHVMALGEDSGALSFYAIRGGLSLLGALPSVIKGTWTHHRSVRHLSSPQLTLTEKGQEGREKTIVVDGEIKKTQYPLNVTIIPKGLTFFTPAV